MQGQVKGKHLYKYLPQYPPAVFIVDQQIAKELIQGCNKPYLRQWTLVQINLNGSKGEMRIDINSF